MNVYGLCTKMLEPLGELLALLRQTPVWILEEMDTQEKMSVVKTRGAQGVEPSLLCFRFPCWTLYPMLGIPCSQ